MDPGFAHPRQRGIRPGGWPAWTLRAFTGLIGAGLVVVGNIMPRTRPNWIAGLRTRAALASPDAWRTTHRRFGSALMIVGILVIGSSILAPSWALVVAAAGSLVAAIVATARPTVTPVTILLLLAATAPPA